MGKKVLAAFLTLTLPIWVIPVGIAFLIYVQVSFVYYGILNFLEGKTHEDHPGV